MTGTFTQVFGGNVIYPSDVSYVALALDADTTLAWPNDTNSQNVAARIVDVTPSGPFTITLADTRTVGTGTTLLFNNLGPDTITVNKADGNAVLSISAGEQWQIYLVDNSTEAGSWRSFRYGAATAQAQAAALAGAGLEANGSLLEQTYPVTDFSSTPYSLTDPDRAKTLVWTGGLGTLNLPAAAAVGDGWFVLVRNAGQGALSIDPSGAETINDGATLVLQPDDSAVVVCDGAEWFTIGYGQQPVFAFDYTSIAVTGGTYTLSGSELNRIAYKFTGVLGSNATIVVPSTIQQYWVNNATTGAFTLSLKTAGGSPTAVNQGETAILYCDGSSIISATTSSPFAGTLAISQGGTGATTASSARTNLGATGIGSSVFTAATTADARTAIAAAASGANSDITSLSALSTPLSVAQGGTGGANAATARTNLGAAASGGNTDITSLSPAGGLTVGAPTGGAQGAGTVNATGLFINGVAVGTGSGSVTSVAASGGTTGLSFTGSPITTSGTLTLTGTLGAANGGTGQTSYTDGQLLIGNTGTGGLNKATLTAGTGISITNGAGSITINSTTSGTVTSVDVSGSTTGLTFTGGPITTSGTITLGGTLAIANGGTGASSASGARLNLGLGSLATLSTINNSNWSGTALAVGNGGTGQTSYTDGQLLIGNTGTGGLNRTTLTAGTGISITNGAGSVTISSTISGTVTSVDVSGAATGLTFTGGPVTTSGTITLGGTLALANGGTGASNASGARTNLGLGSLATLSTINNSNWSGTALAVGNGGTGATSLTSGYLLKGNGSSAVTSSVVYDDGTNVGIGTASPGTKLDVAGNLRFSAANPVIELNNGGPQVYTTVANTLQFATGGGIGTPTERMRIDNSGNLGVGSTSPAGRLDVTGTNGSVVVNGAGDQISYSYNGLNYITATGAAATLRMQASGASGALSFATNGGERLYISSTGAITSSDLADAVGYKGMPQNAQTASYTLVLSDQSKDIYISGTTAAQTVTIPANASVAFPTEAVIQITNDSNQNWSIAITSDTLVWSPSGTTGTRTLAPYGQATLRKVSATRWWISGVGLT